jgi:hypothetical protein
MLASRVAHASAKGRSQQSGLPKPSWAYAKVAAKIFRTSFPSKATLPDPVATCFIGKSAHVMICGAHAANLWRGIWWYGGIFGSAS